MFFIQHGYGKSNKIQAVSAQGNVSGVILSPAHEDMAHLAQTADSCRDLGLAVMLDPQSYIYSLSPQGIAKNHADHDLEFTALHWSQPAAEVNRQVAAVGLANANIGNAGGIAIAPSPHQTNLTDYWMPVSLQYSRTASAAWGADQTVASVVIDENLLRSWDAVQEWLDVLTTLDVRGFYLLINRYRTAYPAQAWDEGSLANLMRLIFTLTELNDYEVIWGYSDIDGLLGLGAGATAIASGWSYGLRGFTTTKWTETRSGGAAAVPRIHLNKLWTPIRFNEAEDLFATPEGRAMFPRSLRDHFDVNSFGSWSVPRAHVQHLQVLASRASRLTRGSGISPRLDALESSLNDAIDRFDTIAGLGIALDGRYVGRLRAYLSALGEFRDAESL